MSLAKCSTKHNNDDDDDDEWVVYERSVQSYINRQLSEKPNFFSLSPEERFYAQCMACPIPAAESAAARGSMPIIELPLRINLVRNEYFGCSIEYLNKETIPPIIDLINEKYWYHQAGIYWNLIDIVERSVVVDDFLDDNHDDNDNNDDEVKKKDLEDKIDAVKVKFPKTKQLEMKEIIWSNDLKRTTTTSSNHISSSRNINTNKRRNEVFCDWFLSLYEYKTKLLDAYDIWIFDFIGHGYQGCCIDRQTQTIIIGERSDKGYPIVTRRPHHCIAKTMAHELGHSLGLNHPKGRTFHDGCSQIITSNKKNLMQGGIDITGGGGDHLEQWQICLSRSIAQNWLNKKKKKRNNSHQKEGEGMTNNNNNNNNKRTSITAGKKNRLKKSRKVSAFGVSPKKRVAAVVDRRENNMKNKSEGQPSKLELFYQPFLTVACCHLGINK